MKTFLLSLLCIIPILGFAQEKVIAPQITFKVPLGETATVNDIKIEFLEVVEDSRCPKGTTCVWAGQAKIKLWVTDNVGNSTEKNILFKEGVQQLILQNEEMSLIAFRLNPYPLVNDKGERDYVLLAIKKDLLKNTTD